MWGFPYNKDLQKIPIAESSLKKIKEMVEKSTAVPKEWLEQENRETAGEARLRHV